MKKNIIQEKSFCFSLAIISLYKTLSEKREFIISKQLLRSGTSIGANVHETLSGESRKDFIHNISISLKEAHETEYSLKLLEESKRVPFDYGSHLNGINEIISILTKIIKTSKKNS